MAIKSIIGLVTNPFVLGAAGAYFGHRKYGSKYGHLATAGGAAAGLATGYVVQKYVLPKAAPSLAPSAPAPQQPLQGGQGEYIDWGMNASQGVPHAPPPQYQAAPPPGPSVTPEEVTAQYVAQEDNGSLSGTNGLGSYGSGLNEAGIEEAMAEVREKGLN
jgi:hypothetical protein